MTCNVACPHYYCIAAVAVWCGHPDFAGETAHRRDFSNLWSPPEVFPGRHIRTPRAGDNPPPQWCPTAEDAEKRGE